MDPLLDAEVMSVPPIEQLPWLLPSRAALKAGAHPRRRRRRRHSSRCRWSEGGEPCRSSSLAGIYQISMIRLGCLGPLTPTIMQRCFAVIPRSRAWVYFCPAAEASPCQSSPSDCDTKPHLSLASTIFISVLLPAPWPARKSSRSSKGLGFVGRRCCSSAASLKLRCQDP